MRNIFSILLLFFCFTSGVSQTKYYVDSTGGNDANPGTIGSPWKSVAKVNSSTVQNALVAGDTIFFKRGEKWYTQLKPTKAGNTGNPITYAAYGTGGKPEVTGFTPPIVDWTSIGGNIYESTNAISDLTTVSTVTINDTFQRMGREPDWGEAGDYPGDFQGLRKIVAVPSTTQVQANNFPNTPSLIGGTMVANISLYFSDTIAITNQTYVAGGSNVGTITIRRAPYYNNVVNGSFFIQNHESTLDNHGEWYFNPTTKKLRVYLNTPPSNYTIRATRLNTVLDVGVSNVSFYDMAFTGGNQDIVNITSSGSDNHIFRECTIKFGQKGIDTDASSGTTNRNDNLTVTYSEISDCQNFGIDGREFGNNPTVTFNYIHDIGMFEGHNLNGNVGGAAAPSGVMGVYFNRGTNVVIDDNILKNCGYIPIRIGNMSGARVRRNYIDGYCIVFTDGGGLYGGYTSDTTVVYTDNLFEDNIVKNGQIRSLVGFNTSRNKSAGLYLDANASGYTWNRNYVYHSDSYGSLNNSTENCVYTNNLFYGAATAAMWWQHFPGSRQNQNNTIRDNIFIAKQRINADAQLAVMFNFGSGSETNTQLLQFDIDKNVYARITTNPTNTTSGNSLNGQVIRWRMPGTYANWQYSTVDQWKALPGTVTNDDSSTAAPLHYPGANIDTLALWLENNSNSDSVVNLSEQYMDMKGNVYYPTITLAPHSAVLLIGTNAPIEEGNQAPTANAGADVAVNFPYPTTQTTTINPTMDVFVHDANPTTNYGSIDSLVVKKNTTATVGFKRISYLKFSLSGYSDIDSVKLRLYGYNAQGSLTLTPSIYPTSDGWTETALTWNTRIPATGSSLGTASFTTTPAYSERDITAHALSQFQSDGTMSIALIDTLMQNEILSIRSRESTTNKPELVIKSINTIELDGSSSFDVDGTITYAWTKVSGPS
jgi:hypothetical protein